MKTKNPRQYVCSFGHQYVKSSDCIVCPICEALKKPVEGFLSKLSAPARRALIAADLNTLEKLASVSESELLALHGIGKASIPLLQEALLSEGMAFRKK